MKKKVYVFDEYASSQKNGIGTFLAEFLYCMKQLEVDICVLVFNANVEEFTIQYEEGVEKILFPTFRIGNFMDNAKIVGVFFQMYIPDSSRNVFFVNHSPCEKLLTEIRKACPQSKLIFTIHDLEWTSAFLGCVNKFKQMIHSTQMQNVSERNNQVLSYYNEEKKMYALVDRVICLSKDTYDLLQDTYSISSDKIILIPNGLRDNEKLLLDNEKNELRQKLFLSKDDKILLFAGRPTFNKGVYALLTAFGMVLEKEPQARLVIAGFDNSANLEKLIMMSSIFASRVTFTGLIDKRRLNEWYSVASVGIIPSYYEQCSYAGIEMMGYGLPIVASDGYGLRNMFHSGMNARIAKIENQENNEVFAFNIATAIIDILTSKKFANKLSKGAKLKYQSIYHICNMQENYKSLLDSL